MLVEAAAPLESGPELAARAGTVVTRAEETFDRALARIASIGDATIEAIRSSARRPDQVTVEFGIKLSASAGAILAAANAEANLKVTLSWSASASDGAA